MIDKMNEMEAEEDTYWGEAAKIAARSGSIGQDEINELMRKMAVS